MRGCERVYPPPSLFLPKSVNEPRSLIRYDLRPSVHLLLISRVLQETISILVGVWSHVIFMWENQPAASVLMMHYGNWASFFLLLALKVDINTCMIATQANEWKFRYITFKDSFPGWFLRRTAQRMLFDISGNFNRFKLRFIEVLMLSQRKKITWSCLNW